MRERQMPVGQILLLLIAGTVLLLALFRDRQPPQRSPMIAYNDPSGNMYLLDLTCIQVFEGCKWKRQPLFRPPHFRDVYFHRWTPNGKYILFYWNDYWHRNLEGFFQVNVETKEIQTLFTSRIDHRDPHHLYLLASVSPNGQKFIFSKYDESVPQDLYLSDINGRNQRPILTRSGFIRRLSWSPDGQYITYESIDGRHTSLWIANADGTDSRLLANNAIEAVWSPDSSQIIYTLAPNEYEYRSNLMRVRPDGSNLVQLTDGPIDHGAAWSPDGQTIAYIASGEFTYESRSMGGDIVLMQPDGSNKHKVTSSVQNKNLLWSPDNGYLAYLSAIPKYSKIPEIGMEWKLFVLDIENSQHHQLTYEEGDYEFTSIIWHP